MDKPRRPSSTDQPATPVRRGRIWRWLVWTVAIGVVVALGLGIVAYRAAGGAPNWYRTQPEGGVGDQAQEALNKLINVREWASQRHAWEQAKARGNEPQIAKPEDELVIAFTQEEVNAFINRWAEWSRQLGDVFRSPQVRIEPDRITVAGTVPSLGNRVVSLDVQPLVEDGKLRLQLLRVRSGNLPLPEFTWSKPRAMIIAALEEMEQRFAKTAKMDQAGGANGDAVSAAMARQGIDALNHAATVNVLFLPVISASAGLPVRLKSCDLQEGMITLTTVPLDGPQREELLKTIKGK